MFSRVLPLSISFWIVVFIAVVEASTFQCGGKYAVSCRARALLSLGFKDVEIELNAESVFAARILNKTRKSNGAPIDGILTKSDMTMKMREEKEHLLINPSRTSKSPKTPP